MIICPCCGSVNTERFYRAGKHPQSLLEMYRCGNDSVAIPLYEVDIHVCWNCEHFFNASYVEVNNAYSNDGCRMWNNGKEWKRHVQRVQSDIENLPVDLVIEVGAGDGSFLNNLRVDSVKLAIDPAASIERCEEFGIPYERNYFDPYKHIPEGAKSSIIIMRHFLEHIQRPRLLLESIANACREQDESYLLVEVPCIENAVSCGRIEDWTYEHLHHFTQNSLLELLRSSGFSTLKCRYAYNNEVLVVLAMRYKIKSRIDLLSALERYEGVERAVQRTKEKLHKWRNYVAYWGGAGKSVLFLRKFDVPHDAIVVDSDLNKQGFYVPSTRIKIQPPSYLVYKPRTHIVATTSWRASDIRNEIKKHCIPCEHLWKFENGQLVEIPLGN